MTEETLPSRIERLRSLAWSCNQNEELSRRYIATLCSDAEVALTTLANENAELRRRLAVAREAVMVYGPAGMEFDWGDGLKDRALDATNLEKPFKEKP